MQPIKDHYFYFYNPLFLQLVLENLNSARQDFSRKLKWDPSDFSGEKLSWRLLPSAARVRPASAAAHNSPSVRCTPLAYANDLTPCRIALHFDYASAAAPTSSKRPAPTATRGSSYTAPLALRFLYSFSDQRQENISQ